MSHTYTDAAVFDSAITLPDDGDQITAASVNVALEAMADRTRFLGAYCTVFESYGISGAPQEPGQVHGTATTSTSWVDIKSSLEHYLFSAGIIGKVQLGDRLFVDLLMHANVTFGASKCYAKLCLKRLHDGSYIDLGESTVLVANNDPTNEPILQYHSAGMIQLNDPLLLSGDFDIVIRGKTSSDQSVLNIWTPTCLKTRIVRSL